MPRITKVHQYLKELVALENDVHRKATYAMSIGVIYRDRLRDQFEQSSTSSSLGSGPLTSEGVYGHRSLLRGRSPHLMEQCLKG